MKFGVREICDVVLKAKANQRVGNKIFYKNEPVIYFDTLKTSSMEGAATTVYAQGGRGNFRLIAWEGERTVTFTMEDALISPAGFMILSGAGLIEAGNGEKIFAAIAAGLCIGFAIALAFKSGGSTGGADILAVIIQKKFAATSIAWMLFIINCTVISASIFVFKADTLALRLLPIMMAAFESYIESKTNEAVTNGFHSAREFRIITEKPEEMAAVLMHELSRGVTAIPATGMYTKTTKTMLLCVVSRRQVVALRRIMKTVDPDSFAVMSNVSQVLGLGFFPTDER